MSNALSLRPVDSTYGLPVPFASETDDGVVDHTVVVRRRAIRCALSRICGACGETLSWPVAFVGPIAEAEAGLFVFPPMHPGCAHEALELLTPAGAILGQKVAPTSWMLVKTSGFDLIRPEVRGEPVLFRANSVVDTIEWP